MPAPIPQGIQGAGYLELPQIHLSGLMLRMRRAVHVGIVFAVLGLLAAAPLAQAATPSSDVVLGGKDYGAPYGEGWGTVRPHTISNGGASASGRISQVRWSAWGGPVALAWGRLPLYKPNGGYYRRPVAIKVRADKLGECEGRTAYTRLSIRYPKRPGGKLGPWRLWSGTPDICSSPYARLQPATFWTTCAPVAEYQISILAHGVACANAKQTIQRLYVKGQAAPNSDGAVTVNGFRCSLSLRYGGPSSPARPVTCKNGSKRIKAAMPA
jgi:hypothetical protein